MYITEKELEDLLTLENTEELRKRGLGVFRQEKLHRQLNLGVYGVADLIGCTFESDGNGNGLLVIKIYELKRDEIGLEALCQAFRYKKAIENFFESIEFTYPLDISLILIGASLSTKKDFIFLAQSIEYLTCFTYNLSLSGLMFEEVDIESYDISAPDSTRRYGNLATAKLFY